jgi:hypothetical protein
MRLSARQTDYILRVKVTSNTQPVAVALIEAQAENLPLPSHRLEQAIELAPEELQKVRQQ